MKKLLAKTILSGALVITMCNVKAQTWDTIMNGIQKFSFSPYHYPDCSEILVLNGQTLLGASSTGIYKSTNYGETWTRKSFGTSQGYNGVRKVKSNRILALGLLAPAPVLKSDDGGETWSNSATGIPNGVIIEDLSMSPNGNIYLAGRSNTTGNTGVYVSTDNGDNWTKKNTGLPALASSTLWSVLALDDNTILAGANNGIYKTTDGADTWTSVQNSGSDYVMCLKKNSNGNIYAGYTSNNIYKSTDNGGTWSSTSLVSSSATVNDIEFDAAGNIYVCHFLTGVVKYDVSETLLETIGNSGNGLTNTRINDLIIDESGTDLVLFASSVGTANSGGYFYRYGYTSGGGNTGIKENVNTLAFEIFPNPSNNHLFMSGVETMRNFTASIHTIDGKLVGEYKLTNNTTIDISTLNAGLYFITVTDNNGNSGIQKFIKQ